MQQILSYIEINKQNILHNLEVLKAFSKSPKKYVAVIKANAYGHGQNEVATLIESYVDYFQLDDIEELRLLRKVSAKPTLILGYVLPNNLEELVSLKGIPAIYDVERLLLLNAIGKAQNKKIEISVKIDALLGRQGILLKDLPEFLAALRTCANIKVQSVYSHFSDADNVTTQHSQKQLDQFKTALAAFKEIGIADFETHISASSGFLTFDSIDTEFSMVRLGFAMYGLWPSVGLRQKYGDVLELKPVLRWLSHVAQVKVLPANYPVGYGLTYTTEKETKIAVVPQGYSDGYDREMSNKGEVLIQGTRCRVLGRISMNIFIVDVNHLPEVVAGDEVIILGKQGNEEITAERIASIPSTINYETVARISPLLPRVVV